MILVHRVTHHYGVRPILRDISLHVRRGELLALMGPNGMGKSTLLGVMAGYLSPIEGYVEIDGNRRRRTPEEELAIRKMTFYLSAEPWIPPSMTGREWLLAVGRVYGIADLHLMEHIERLFQLFSLTEQADSITASYSSGQKKKVALASALVSEAPLLLLDEPFSGGLDPSGILAMKRILLQLVKERGTTIVMATPVPELVQELADRIAVVRDGRLIACDTFDGLRSLTGLQAPLDEVYERLACPESSGNVEQYFQSRSGNAAR